MPIKHLQLIFIEWSALLQNCIDWFLNFRYSVSLCLLECIAIATLTFIESLSLSAYPLSMDQEFTELYFMNTELAR